MGAFDEPEDDMVGTEGLWTGARGGKSVDGKSGSLNRLMAKGRNSVDNEWVAQRNAREEKGWSGIMSKVIRWNGSLHSVDISSQSGSGELRRDSTRALLRGRSYYYHYVRAMSEVPNYLFTTNVYSYS